MLRPLLMEDENYESPGCKDIVFMSQQLSSWSILAYCISN